MRTDAGQPPAKISAQPGLSGSSGVFRTNVGHLIRSFPGDGLTVGTPDTVWKCSKCGVESKAHALLIGKAEKIAVADFRKSMVPTITLELHCPACGAAF